MAVFPAAPSSTRSPMPALVERWDALDRRSASGCWREIEPLRKDKQIGSSLQAKVVLSAADGRAARCSSATPRSCRCCSSCRRSSCGRVDRTSSAPTRRMPRIDDRARRRREVRALLALRAEVSRAIRRGPASATAARTRWRRPIHGMTRSSRIAVTARRRAARRIEIVAAAGHRRRSIRSTKAMVRATLPLHESVTVIPGFSTSRTCGTPARRSAS